MKPTNDGWDGATIGTVTDCETGQSKELMLPWVRKAREYKRAAYKRYLGEQTHLAAIEDGTTTKPQKDRLTDDPWFYVLHAESVIRELEMRTPGSRLSLDLFEDGAGLKERRRRRVCFDINTAWIAFTDAERVLVERPRSAAAAAAMFKLGEVVEALKRHAPPAHIVKLNTDRKAGGEVRQIIREAVHATHGLQGASEILDTVCRIVRWNLKDDIIWASPRRRGGKPRRIVTLPTFNNYVSEERSAFKKSIMTQPVQ